MVLSYTTKAIERFHEKPLQYRKQFIGKDVLLGLSGDVVSESGFLVPIGTEATVVIPEFRH